MPACVRVARALALKDDIPETTCACERARTSIFDAIDALPMPFPPACLDAGNVSADATAPAPAGGSGAGTAPAAAADGGGGGAAAAEASDSPNASR